MVGPSWGGEVDGLVGRTRVEFGEEEGSEVDGAGAGDGLEACGLSSVSVCDVAFAVVVLLVSL